MRETERQRESERGTGRDKERDRERQINGINTDNYIIDNFRNTM